MHNGGVGMTKTGMPKIDTGGEGGGATGGGGAGGNCAAAAEAEGCGRCSMPLHLYYKSGNSGTEPYIVAHDLVTAGLDEAGIKHLGDRVAGEEDAAAMADGKPDDEGKGGEARTYHQREVQYVGGGTPASRRRATTSWGGAGRRSLGEESGGGDVFTSRVATSPNPRAPPSRVLKCMGRRGSNGRRGGWAHVTSHTKQSDGVL